MGQFGTTCVQWPLGGAARAPGAGTVCFVVSVGAGCWVGASECVLGASEDLADGLFVFDVTECIHLLGR